jgi:hypothetical protein
MRSKTLFTIVRTVDGKFYTPLMGGKFDWMNEPDYRNASSDKDQVHA